MMIISFSIYGFDFRLPSENNGFKYHPTSKGIATIQRNQLTLWNNMSTGIT